MFKRFKKWIIGFFIGSAVLAGGYGYLGADKIPAEHKLKCDKSKILFNKDIDWIIQKEDGSIENKGKIKSYLYISNKKVLAIKDEDITKRTKNAQFIKKEKKDGKQEWNGRFYIGEPFYKDGNDWFQTETATTTIETFNEQIKVSLLDSLLDRFLGREVLADSATYYAGTGDGFHDAMSNTSYAAANGASSAWYYGNYTNWKAQNAYKSSTEYWYCARIHFPIDTSGLPDDATINSAKVYFYATTKFNADGDYLRLVKNNNGNSNNYLNHSDCNDYTTTALATDLDITNITTSAYNYFTLNSTGLNNISKTAYSYFAIRTKQDCDATAPTAINSVNMDLADQTGSATDPYLEIIYNAERRIIIIN